VQLFLLPRLSGIVEPLDAAAAYSFSTPAALHNWTTRMTDEELGSVVEAEGQRPRKPRKRLLHSSAGRQGRQAKACARMGKQSLFLSCPQAFHHNRPNHSPDSMRRSHGINSRPRGSGMPGDTFTFNSSSHPNTTSKMLRQADGHDTVQKILRAADVHSQLISNRVES
jgi:hypothetical protein